MINNRVEKNEIVEFYNKHYKESDLFYPNERLYRWILNKIKSECGEQLLDIACGLGIMSKIGNKMGFNSIGVDVSYQALIRAINEFSGNKLTLADGEHLPFSSGSFNVITNIGSLEHFISMETGMNEMKRVLKHNGTIALLLPNSYYLFDIIWEVLRKGYRPSHLQPVERFATSGEWQEFIKSSGYEIQYVCKYNFSFPTTKNDWKYYLRRPQRLIKVIFGPLIPFNLSYCFLFIIKPKTDKLL